ncbi:leucine-rich repeat and coiled-coil domain-containing protein 1 isoform X2 [Patella vulgata]|uniref:leucine-rich repeat and coiled-coil domain-containing protein 1 isoform X2 n=1 Tax=Patella vulgata TaxID=6465 RepID=UPI00217F59F0|nr:leucine-rich repeat and coiled-coil domain-containing protein 1 isoform X2 [Patella vulgata]
MATSSLDLSSTELSLIDCGVSGLLDLPLQSHLLSLNLHSNYIQRLENLNRLTLLRHLDLSSNQITKIEGLDSLKSLRTLNLSCNLICVVEGLFQLRSLVKLNLSFNQIDDVSGFKFISGSGFKLAHIELHGNRIRSAVRFAHSLSQCSNLQDLVLSQEGSSNPVCHQTGYRSDLLSRLPQLKSLDGRDKYGHISVTKDIIEDIPGLDEYIEYLDSTSTTDTVQEPPVMDLITPKIDEAMEQFKRRCQTSYDTTTSISDVDRSPSQRNIQQPSENPDYTHRLEQLESQISQLLNKNQQVYVAESSRPTDKENRSLVHSAKLQAERDIVTEESEDDINKTPIKKSMRKQRKTKVPNYQRQTVASGVKKDSLNVRSTTSSEDMECRISLEDRSLTVKAQKTIPVKSVNLDHKLRQDTATTYTQMMKELEQERERRWKSEQATKKLADYIKELQEKAKEDSNIKATAIDATSHLKNALMNEKETKEKLKAQSDSLQEKVKLLKEELCKSRQHESSQKEAIKSMEETLTKQEREKLQQDAHINKKYQEVQMRCAALNREVDMLRQSSEKQKHQIHQLQELLANREQEHREELKKRYTLDSPQLQSVIEKEIKQIEKEYKTEVKTQQEKIDVLGRQYTELEDEFRMALQIEASRFQQVQEAFERISEENAGNKTELMGALKKDEKASAMLKELSLLVKEQKGRIAELSKSKQEQALEYRERVQTLEAHVEEARKRMVQFELLKKEKGRISAELDAKQSVIDGLKAERKLWGQELAQQGSSLAQDRGRLEAKIETLQVELNTMKKHLEKETDVVKIKTKMIDDQTESIKKLKEGLLERDEEIRKSREEALRIQKSLEEQLAEEKSISQDNQEMVERLQERKTELKQQIEDLKIQLDESQNAHSVLNNKWKEKSNLISSLEQQVGQMKQSWEDKEKRLTKERDRAVEATSLAVQKLKSIDETFHQKLEAKDRSYHDHINQLEEEKRKEIEQANRQVFVVEQEMRDLLRETESNKRGMEDKVKQMTKALASVAQ